MVENPWSKGITTSSVDPQPLDHVTLDLEGHDQLRRRIRVQNADRMRLEGQHRVGSVDHQAMPDVDAVEGPDRDVPGPPLGALKFGDLNAHLESVGEVIGCSVHRPVPPEAFHARSPGSRPNASASARNAGASSTENGPTAVRRRLSQYASPSSATRLRT